MAGKISVGMSDPVDIPLEPHAPTRNFEKFTWRDVHSWEEHPERLCCRTIGKPLRLFVDEGTAPAFAGLQKDMEHIRLKTNDDGACALHSVFGLPTMDKQDGIEFFVSDARQRLVRTFGATAQEFQQRLKKIKVASHEYRH